MIVEKNYMPERGSLWDFCLVGSQGHFHLFHLHDERDMPLKNDRKWSIGHAVSKDLVNWQEEGIVLRAQPELGIHGLATGSALKALGGSGGVMALTVCAGRTAVPLPDGGEACPRADYAIALAESPDMNSWSFAGPPIIYEGSGLFEDSSAARDNLPGCHSFGDPWLFSLKGEHSVAHLLVNTRLKSGEMLSRGALAHAALQDGKVRGDLDLFFAPGISMRLETPQLFEKKGRWHLMASVSDSCFAPGFLSGKGLKRLDAAAIVFTSDSPFGPFDLKGDWALFPGTGCYICKVVPEEDVILTIRSQATQYPPAKGETGLSFPHRIAYPEAGGLRILGRA
jgi:beta-fructofuranosidase